jgi:hypothetical protein
MSQNRGAVLRPATIHTLKIWPVPFDAVVAGKKLADVRRSDDREFLSGDLLLFRCWQRGEYLGPCVLARITNVTRHAGDLDLYLVDQGDDAASRAGRRTLSNFIGYPAAALSFEVIAAGEHQALFDRAAILATERRL